MGSSLVTVTSFLYHYTLPTLYVPVPGNIGGTSSVVMRLTESVKPDKHPSLGSDISPSQQAESGYFPENSHRVNVHDRWVALELFKVWEWLQKAHLDFGHESITIKVDDAYAKSNDIRKSQIECFSYSLSVMSRPNNDMFRIHLALPCSRHEAHLVMLH